MRPFLNHCAYASHFASRMAIKLPIEQLEFLIYQSRRYNYDLYLQLNPFSMFPQPSLLEIFLRTFATAMTLHRHSPFLSPLMTFCIRFRPIPSFLPSQQISFINTFQQSENQKYSHVIPFAQRGVFPSHANFHQAKFRVCRKQYFWFHTLPFLLFAIFPIFGNLKRSFLFPPQSKHYHHAAFLPISFHASKQQYFYVGFCIMLSFSLLIDFCKQSHNNRLIHSLLVLLISESKQNTAIPPQHYKPTINNQTINSSHSVFDCQPTLSTIRLPFFAYVQPFSCRTSLLLIIIAYQEEQEEQDSKNIRRRWSVPCQLQELLEKGLTSNEVGLPLGLAHAGRSEGDDDGIIPEEGDDGDAAKLHVKLLLLLLVNLTLRLVDLEEVLNHGLIDVVADGVLDLLHVEVKLVGSPRGVMAVVIEELAYQFLRFVFLEQK